MLEKIGKYVASMLSASDEASFGRFASLLALVFCLGWDTAYLIFVMRHFQQFHFAPSDLLAFGGVLMVEGGFCTLFYGVNKLSGMGVFNRGPQDKQ